MALRASSFRLEDIDCITGMKSMPEDSVDVVVTSPPYNLGIKYGTHDDDGPRGDYLDWMESVAGALRRVLGEDGSLFLNLGGKPTDPWVPHDVARRFRRHFELQNTIIWVKSISIGQEEVGRYGILSGDLSVGHFKPVNSQRFLNDAFEYIFHFTPRGRTSLDRLAVGVPYQDKSNIARWKGVRADLRCRGNTWFIPYETIQHRKRDRPHPATFPIMLPQRCIQLHGLRPDLVVMDPFMGIGSTALACQKLGLGCVGFEVDSDYLEVARERLGFEG